MPHHLDIYFSEKSTATYAQLVLMHSDEGIINKVDDSQDKNTISCLWLSRVYR